MSLPQYPAELPPPGLDGYRLDHVDPLMRTQLASGRARQRRRFTSVPTMVPVEWLLTAGEFALFEAWYRYAIEDGAEWFTGRLKTSAGIDDHEQRFTGIYRARALGPNHWRVEAELELRERQTVPRDWLLFAPQFLVHASLIDRALNREWPTA